MTPRRATWETQLAGDVLRAAGPHLRAAYLRGREDALRANPRASAASMVAQLSEREVDVIRLAARGLENAEIASEMFLATDTIKTHMRRAMAKLGAKNRAQAAALLVVAGRVTAADVLPKGGA